ncbi:hypothetical protein IJ732_03770 [bacterium]|nr:hypothetical protein [bacterium]
MSVFKIGNFKKAKVEDINLTSKNITAQKTDEARNLNQSILDASVNRSKVVEGRDTQLSFSGNMSLTELENVNAEVSNEEIVTPTKEEVETEKNNAVKAKRAFNQEPSGTKRERELQKAYLDAENTYVQKVLDCKESTESDWYNAANELKIIIDITHHPAVQDKVAVSKELLAKVQEKLDAVNEEKWQELLGSSKDELDVDMTKQIAEASKKQVGYNKKSSALCAMFVREALEKTGVVEKNETRVISAYMLTKKYEETGSFMKLDIQNYEDLKDLPPGCIIVWEKGPGFGSAFAQHGHVAVTQGDGKATSDYNQMIKDYGTKFSVFVPKKVTTEERIQNAQKSREEFLSIPNRKAADNIVRKQYLFDYVKAAKAILDDKNVSKDEIQNLIKLMEEVKTSNIVPQEQSVAIEIQKLIPKLKALLK